MRAQNRRKTRLEDSWPMVLMNWLSPKAAWAQRYSGMVILSASMLSDHDDRLTLQDAEILSLPPTCRSGWSTKTSRNVVSSLLPPRASTWNVPVRSKGPRKMYYEN